MKTLIIDVSAATFRDYVRLYGTLDGILYGFWYRVVRPAMVTAMWVMFGLYVYHSLVMVGGTAAQLAELIVYVAVVAYMAAALIGWMIVCRFRDWIRMQDRYDADAAPMERARDLRWRVPPGLRQMQVVHDEHGHIVQIRPWRPADPMPALPDGDTSAAWAQQARREPALAA